MLCRVIVRYEVSLKGNISTLIISILDILTGVLSVALAVYAIKAVSVALSTFKSTKIAIQSSKALKLAEVGKPIVKTALPKMGGCVGVFILSLKKKRGNTMAEKENKQVVKKERKPSPFLIYLKNNPKTIVGLIVSIITSAMSGAGVSLGMIFGAEGIPVWAGVLVGVVLFGLLLTALCFACLGQGLETPQMVALRKVIKEIGFGDALNIVEAEYAKCQAEQAQKDAINRAKYEQSYKNAVVNGTYNGSLDDYIVEQGKLEKENEIAKKQAELENLYKNAVVQNNYTKSFEEFCKEHKWELILA